MAESTRVGIIGGGWPGAAHARGYLAAGAFKLVAVADLIPDRRRKMMAEFSIPREYAEAADLIADREIDAVSVCLPNHLHLPVTLSALRAGKHVICETPPALAAREVNRMQAAAAKAGKALLFALQRRFGPHEQAARAAIVKGFAGDVYHVRATWTRTRGIPLGTGWFTEREKSGGGALVDIGVHMLDLAWHLLGQPAPASAFGVTYSAFRDLLPPDMACDVEDVAFALVRFNNGKSLELAASWAINQPPHQNGAVCRVYGTAGGIEVYTPKGATLYRDFKADGACKENPLKPPRLVHHAALCRHFRECIQGKATPMPGAPEAAMLMAMVEAVYKSSQAGRSVAM